MTSVSPGTGDSAYETGTSMVTVSGKQMAGKYVVIYERVGNQWLIALIATVATDDPRSYTAKHQELTREKIARIRAPILIVQGDPESRLNRFNGAVLVPELRAASKSVDVRTYPGGPHCFGFYGSGPRTPRPAAALKVFHDVDAFFRRYVDTKPKPINPSVVRHAPPEPW